MSSVSLTNPTNEAFADIKEEITAEEAADPTKRKLGVLFWICVGWIVLVAFAATFASLLPLPNPNLGNYNSVQNAGPSWGHLLGTDDLYRDIFSRLIYGARVSLVVGFGGALIGLIVGGIPAMISAYRRGRIDTALNTGSYVVLAFPAIVAVIAIVSFWGKSLFKITLIIGLFAAPLIFRVVRASTLSYATRDFVLAAKALGASDTRILSREILPNIMPTIVSFGLIAVATIVVLEGSLAFLGLSVPPPTRQLGQHAQRGVQPAHRGQGADEPVVGHLPGVRHVPAADQPQRRGRQTAGLLRRHGDQAVSGRRLLDVEDLHVSFATSRGPLQAVQGVSLTLDQGKTLGIVGESGSGKTVLSRAIMGLLPRASTTQTGSVRYDGTEILNAPNDDLRKLWSTHIAMVFQDPMTSLNPVQRIGNQITEPLKIHLNLSKGEAKETALSLLMQVGIPSPVERYEAYPFELSGGMRQRVMIAIALACAPRLLMADEPTTGLDVTVQAQILDLLSQLQHERDMAMILVTHDLGVVATRTDEIIVMYAGNVVERAPTNVLFKSMAMPYTEALLKSTPRIAEPSHTRLTAIEGRPPDLLNPPSGCPFSPRCPYAQEKCHLEKPPLVEAAPGHSYACWYPLTASDPASQPSPRPDPVQA